GKSGSVEIQASVAAHCLGLHTKKRTAPTREPPTGANPKLPVRIVRCVAAAAGARATAPVTAAAGAARRLPFCCYAIAPRRDQPRSILPVLVASLVCSISSQTA